MTKSKAKPKAKPKARETESREKFIIKGGSHSRMEGGKRVKYECGDVILLSAAEVEEFPLKFLSIEAYESLVAADETRRRADRALSRISFPPRVHKRGARDAEALRRQKRLLKMQHRGERRTFIS